MLRPLRLDRPIAVSALVALGFRFHTVQRGHEIYRLQGYNRPFILSFGKTVSALAFEEDLARFGFTLDDVRRAISQGNQD